MADVPIESVLSFLTEKAGSGLSIITVKEEIKEKKEPETGNPKFCV